MLLFVTYKNFYIISLFSDTLDWNQTFTNNDVPNELDIEVIENIITPSLPSIREAEIVECVQKYMDGTSQNLQNLSPY